MPYEFSNKGVSLLYVDALNNSSAMNSMITNIRNNGLLSFLTANFTISNDQQSFLNDIPTEILTNIGNNLCHALENDYSISIDIDFLTKAFPTGGSTAPVPTYQSTKLSCKFGHWTEHQYTCQNIENYGLICKFND